jgi:hypothetical protein
MSEMVPRNFPTLMKLSISYSHVVTKYLLHHGSVIKKVKVKVTLRLSVSQSVSLGVDPHLCSWPDIYYSLTVMVLFLWGALSDKRTGLSFVYAAGPRQHSHSRVQVPWESWPYFTVSDLRRPFSLPPTTRRVTVEVFDPASTWVLIIKWKT